MHMTAIKPTLTLAQRNSEGFQAPIIVLIATPSINPLHPEPERGIAPRQKNIDRFEIQRLPHNGQKISADRPHSQPITLDSARDKPLALVILFSISFYLKHQLPFYGFFNNIVNHFSTMDGTKNWAAAGAVSNPYFPRRK